MQVVVTSHPSALLHDTGSFHPERPERVTAARRGVDAAGLEIVEVRAPEISLGELSLVHEMAYIEMIETVCAKGGGALDMDTFLSVDSWQAALTAAGAIGAAIEELGARDNATGFALTRPPGHHALPDRAMGFCLFNNIAVAAAVLRERGERVAILDWDVHHGNGTQAVYLNDPGALYVSLHQHPFYPFEGHISDIDRGEAKGTTINVPLPTGTAGDVYRRAWREIVTPVVSQFGPDWALISAGYDAHSQDPLGGLDLVAADYGWMAAQLAGVHPPNRTVLALEGGYDLEAIEASVAATLQGLAGLPFDDPDLSSPESATAAVDAAAQAVARYWSL